MALFLVVGFTATLVSCTKSEDVQVSAPIFKVGAAISTKTPLAGIVKGTLLADSTYRVSDNVFINEGDTLLIQPGAKILFDGKGVWSFIVKGSLLSLGTQAKPIYFTVANTTKTDVLGADVTKDPAYTGLWGGILGETTFKNIIIKWTHLEFGGGRVVTSPVSFVANGGVAYTISSVNADGIVVLEDSWVYGSVDDPIRPFGGKYNVMRNTFEKCGFTGGEAFNVKGGTVGNFAYNLVIGAATNGPKPSNDGAGTKPQTNILIYNNTLVANGFRRSADGRGGSINFENGAKGAFYNNLIVNSKYGPRIVGASATYSGNALLMADTANIKYGYNYNYVDSLKMANQIYPVGFTTKPQPTDFPAPASFLPAGYKLGQAYDGAAIVQKNNPQFVNFPLPYTATKKVGDASFVGTFNFRLQPGSPALGKGTTSFTPLQVVPVSERFGSSEITPPSTDVGCYPASGKGNLH
ncbi:hypothetical protein J2I48_15370 [Fibrella sp. HMF5036]|uniref:Right-handed parallel beta-helix repeat-containing protein n=1 Tax=Fibrella aquatilis TaxID=2817059 RepID=A0A939G7E1_9BACT|nr:hypothetical protein [Fibrella aquatilis]